MQVQHTETKSYRLTVDLNDAELQELCHSIYEAASSVANWRSDPTLLQAIYEDWATLAGIAPVPQPPVPPSQEEAGFPGADIPPSMDPTLTDIPPVAPEHIEPH